MRKRTIAVYVIAALLAGVVIGSIGLAAAATSTDSSASAIPTAACPGPYGAGRGAGPEFGKGGFGWGMGGGMMLRVVSKLTGESTETVLAARQSGKSFAEIAKAEGVSVAQVVELALAAPKAALDSEVSNGLVTRSEANSFLAALKTRVTDMVNGTGVPGSGGWRGGPGHRRGVGGPPPAATPDGDVY